MTTLELTLLIGGGAFLAGLLGALTGLGGGVVIVPLLTLGFGIDFRYAVGASLVSVIATSSGAAVAYVREGYTNIRVGMLLEVATTVGALFGAGLAAWIAPSTLAVVFGLVLLGSAGFSARPRPEHVVETPDPTPLGTVLAIGGLGGWISAFGGAWKDAPKEGFQTLKFFRSPFIATVYALLLSRLTDDLVLNALAALGFTIATTETYKTFFFPSKPRGKFAGMPVLYPDMLRKRQPFIALYAAIWLVVIVAWIAAAR